MSYGGKVRNGVVEVEPGVQPPDGVVVQITVVPASEAADDDGSLSTELLKLAGTCRELPTDAAENLDHYLHGLSKRWTGGLPMHSTTSPSFRSAQT